MSSQLIFFIMIKPRHAAVVTQSVWCVSASLHVTVLYTSSQWTEHRLRVSAADEAGAKASWRSGTIAQGINDFTIMRRYLTNILNSYKIINRLSYVVLLVLSTCRIQILTCIVEKCWCNLINSKMCSGYYKLLYLKLCSHNINCSPPVCFHEDLFRLHVPRLPLKG